MSLRDHSRIAVNGVPVQAYSSMELRSSARPRRPRPAVPATVLAGSAPVVPSARLKPAEPNIAAQIRALVVGGARDAARDRFAELVTAHQRRATRLAYHLLRDAEEADEAVQDAFLKAFTHITAYDDRWPFEAWFTRILVNTCRDRRKARARRLQWVLPSDRGIRTPEQAAGTPSAEAQLLARERWGRLAEAVDQLPGRQRTIFVLCHFGEHSAGDVSTMIGLSEATVRVHLFRAVRKLRRVLEEWRERR